MCVRVCVCVCVSELSLCVSIIILCSVCFAIFASDCDDLLNI